MGSEAGLRLLVLPGPYPQEIQRAVSQTGAVVDRSFFGDLEDRLKSYLAGRPVSFDDVKLDLSGTADFHRRVWRETRSIRYGQTRSYQWLAQQAGSPRGARAVGRAMAANAVPIIIPCHRVITSQGKLGGFGGGLDLKRHLLGIEIAGLRQAGGNSI